MRETTLEAIPYEGERHEKAWGHELWIINNELYCGKLLVFKANKQFSMHYHLIKDETWYVNEGQFLYRWIDTETAEIKEQHLYVGDVVRQRVGQPHQLIALTDGVVFEVSTQHFNADSYRVKPGSSQAPKKENHGHTELYWDIERNK